MTANDCMHAGGLFHFKKDNPAYSIKPEDSGKKPRRASDGAARGGGGGAGGSRVGDRRPSQPYQKRPGKNVENALNLL